MPFKEKHILPSKKKNLTLIGFLKLLHLSDQTTRTPKKQRLQ